MNQGIRRQPDELVLNMKLINVRKVAQRRTSIPGTSGYHVQRKINGVDAWLTANPRAAETIWSSVYVIHEVHVRLNQIDRKWHFMHSSHGNLNPGWGKLRVPWILINS